MEIINLGTFVVNAYLLKIEKKLILIDTGYPGGYERFQKNLSKHNLSPGDIDYVILTHAHDDHAGFLEELLSASKAILVLHKDAVNRLLLGHNQWIGGCSDRLAFFFYKAMVFFGKGKHEFPKYGIPANTLVWNGTKPIFEKTGIPITLISLPGHTEDHIGVLVNKKILFCGDAAMNGFPSINRKIIWIEDLETYKASWNKMIQLNFDLAYPAHGNPFKKEDLLKYRKHLDKVKLIKIKAKS